MSGRAFCHPQLTLGSAHLSLGETTVNFTAPLLLVSLSFLAREHRSSKSPEAAFQTRLLCAADGATIGWLPSHVED